jgi:DNA-binding MarR family transcriptional regulator
VTIQVPPTFERLTPAEQREFRKLTGMLVSEFTLLSVIAAHPGIVQAEACRAANVNRSRAYVIVADLTARGLVRRSDDDDDDRIYHLWMTHEGEKRLKGKLKTADEALRLIVEKEAA